MMIKTILKKKHIDKLYEYGLDANHLKQCTIFRFTSGETIYQEDFPVTWLGIVIDGKAKVCCSSANGKNLVLCYFVSTGTIGGIELMANQNYATASLIATTDFECIAIPFEGNEKILRANNKFLNRLCYELSTNLVNSSSNFVTSALHTGEQRLCSYIIESSHNNVFNDVLTDVACSIGLSYHHLNRLLTQLCHENILAKENYGYRIKNMKLLIKKAEDARCKLISS